MKTIVVVGYLLLVGCSSSSTGTTQGAAADGGPVVAPAPAGVLACTFAQDACTCVTAASKSGACSPQTLGTASHCCATVEGGSTTKCTCERDDGSCVSYPKDHSCSCALNTGPLAGQTAVASCSPPSGGHCCKGGSQCNCAVAACVGGFLEVATCTPQDAILTCTAPAIAVSSCQ